MSRVGSLPILIPSGVTVDKTGDSLVVNGPKGSLTINIDPRIKMKIEADTIKLERVNDQKQVKSLHGLIRVLLSNMITGVVSGWSKNLELVGVGFRVSTSGDKLNLTVGFSHPVEIQAPSGIMFEVTDNTKIKVSGIDKYLVGQVAANIRNIRPPDVYKGKGIRYSGEYIRKKVGKSGKVGVAGVGGKA